MAHVAAEDRTACRALLSVAEHARGDAFLNREARDHFLVARATLRRLLGAYLECEPARLAIGADAEGKPRLEDGVGVDLRFNLAHSGGVVMLGVAVARAVGVDVEFMRPLDDLEGVMRTAFTPAERDDVLACAPDARAARFFRLWTRKEAYLKATGRGLSGGMAHIDARGWGGGRDGRPGAPAPHGGPSWPVHDIEADDGVVGAVVAEAPRRTGT